MSRKKNATFRIEEEMWDKFNEACKKNDRTRGEVLREKIAKYIKKGGRKND